MSEALRLHIHINEPWDFERANGSPEVFGTKLDRGDHDDDEEWEVYLDREYEIHEAAHRHIRISPRYIGESLHRVTDALVGIAIRIAHHVNGEWHYAMTGTLSLQYEELG